MPDTSDYPSTFTTHSTFSRFPSDLLFTLVQASVKHRGLDLSHNPFPHNWWQVQGATRHHDKARLSATLHLNYLLLCKRKKYHECNPVLRMLIDVLFFILFSSFPYRLYLVIVTKKKRKRHNDVTMLSLLSSHYRVYKGFILFKLFCSWVLTTSHHTKNLHQGRNRGTIRWEKHWIRKETLYLSLKQWQER